MMGMVICAGLIAMPDQATKQSSTWRGGDTAHTNMFALYQCDAVARVVKGSPRVSTPTTAPMVRRAAFVSTSTPSGSPSGVMAAGIQERGDAGLLSDSTTITLLLPLSRGDSGVVRKKMACLLGRGSHSHTRLHAFPPWLHAPMHRRRVMKKPTVKPRCRGAANNNTNVATVAGQ